MSQHLKVLLLQARAPADPAKPEEVRSFAQHCGLEPAQIVPWDLLAGPPTMDVIRRHDALMVGGAGEYYVSQGNLPEFPRLMERLREVVEHGFPTFASCFGFQCLVVALDGEIVYDPQNTEVGTFDVTLPAEGQSDELFGALPPTFLAQLGRKDSGRRPVVRCGQPRHLRTLVRSRPCGSRASRVWASQFHPELDPRDQP